MKKALYKMIPLMMAAVMILAGCATVKTAQGSQFYESAATVQQGETQTADNDSAKQAYVDAEEQEHFTSRDLSGEIDTADAVKISLNGSSATASSSAVSISGSTVTITEEGTYILSGSLDDGTIIVDVDKEEKVQLVLNGVSINSNTFAAIYVVQADKVFVTLADGTENTLSNGGTFKQIDDNDVDAAVFAKDDITFNGTGSLTVYSPAGHGIVGKDDVTITDGTYVITTAKTAVRANESLDIADGVFTITAGTDGLHAEDNDDDSTGSVYIAGGTFTIKAGDDGIHATTTLQIDGGTFSITAAEGLEATYIIINDGDVSIQASDDGINAARKSSAYTPTVEINGGNITVSMGAGDTDGIDSNGNIIINGGTVSVNANSPFDYDGTGKINGGTVIVNGQQVSTLPNQMMGGFGGMGGGQMGDGQMGGQMGDAPMGGGKGGRV